MKVAGANKFKGAKPEMNNEPPRPTSMELNIRELGLKKNTTNFYN